DAELREAGQSTAYVSRRERERDPLGEETARDEGERQRRCAVEPLRVVDHAQQRFLLGGFGEDPEHREADKKRARRLSAAQPEGDTQRIALGFGEMLAELEDRRTELLQRRVVELHLPFGSRSPNNAKTH